jgi:IS30 family transposase
MAKGYHHVTHEDRCRIYALKSIGAKQIEISKQLSLSPSTISREICRNQGLIVLNYKTPFEIFFADAHSSSDVILHY